MFIGSFKYSVDAKGRVSIPAKLRKYVNSDANDSFVLTRGAGNCIDVYPMDQWKELVANKLNKLNSFDPEDAMFIRLLLQEASEDTLDSQARLLIPKSLLEYAGIEKEVYIKGALTKIEIWKPNTYEEYLNASPRSYEDIAKEVMKM